MIEKTCKENDIDFAMNRKHQFVICNTVFEFYEIQAIPRTGNLYNDLLWNILGVRGPYIFLSITDNDALYREHDYKDPNLEKKSSRRDF